MTTPVPELREVAVRDVTVGRDVVIYQPANVYGCELGDEVFIGPFVEIQRHSRIGFEIPKLLTSPRAALAQIAARIERERA
ncbi:Acetyltransferase [Cronobacter universalis NCTC 9529]|nr:Acetyltransferase [Cronobacter universalis NCTC 9529]